MVSSNKRKPVKIWFQAFEKPSIVNHHPWAAAAAAVTPIATAVLAAPRPRLRRRWRPARRPWTTTAWAGGAAAPRCRSASAAAPGQLMENDLLWLGLCSRFDLIDRKCTWCWTREGEVERDLDRVGVGEIHDGRRGERRGLARRRRLEHRRRQRRLE